MLKVITTKVEAPAGEAPTLSATLDDLARDGARRMIAAALQLEATEYVARFREARDERGHALVVRNGTARPRPVITGVGPLTVPAPRVNDRRMIDGAQPDRRERRLNRVRGPQVLPVLGGRGAEAAGRW